MLTSYQNVPGNLSLAFAFYTIYPTPPFKIFRYALAARLRIFGRMNIFRMIKAVLETTFFNSSYESLMSTLELIHFL